MLVTQYRYTHFVMHLKMLSFFCLFFCLLGRGKLASSVMFSDAFAPRQLPLTGPCTKSQFSFPHPKYSRIDSQKVLHH